MSRFHTVASRPYAWPYTGGWSMAETALFLIDFQGEAVAETGAEPVVAALAPLLHRWRAAGGGERAVAAAMAGAPARAFARCPA